jgi:hypothetical protein
MKTVADAKMLQEVVSFLERQKLGYIASEEQYCTRLTVKSRGQVVPVSVYNTGTIVVGGPDCSLRRLLYEMRDALLSDAAVPGQALPFEIDRFPETIRERVPECDPVIIAFIAEAIRCLRGEALLGAAFMIGAASEKAVNLLIQSYADAITDAGKRDKFLGRVNNRMISVRWDEFIRSYKSCASRPTEGVLAHDLETIIGTVFQFSRITRNEVGHPQLVPDLDRGVLLANLGHFVAYIERIYGLIKHFRESGVSIA